MLTLKLPEPYEPLLNCGVDDSYLILHAPVDCREVKTLAALTYRDMLRGETVCLSGQGTEQIIESVRTLFKSTKYRLPVNSKYHIKATSGGYAGVDIERYNKKYCLNLHQFKRPTDFNIGFAEFPTLDHWILDESSSIQVIRIPYEDAKRYFYGVDGTGLRKTDPLYERKMNLVDVVPKAQVRIFTRFARERLTIKTDKPPHWLTPEQQEKANRQFGTPLVDFYVSPLQKRYLAHKRRALIQGKKPWYILLKYRRGGFSTIEQGLHYEYAVNNANSNLITIAHTDVSALKIFDIVKTMHENDPKSPEALSKTLSILRLANGSTFSVGTAGGKSAQRGDTINRVHGSEVSKWCEGPNQEILMEEQLAGILGAATYGEVVLESTPNGKNAFYKLYQDAKRGVNAFTPVFLRWFDDPKNRMKSFDSEEIQDTLRDSEKALIERWGLDLAQIAFRRDGQSTYGRLFPQEMPEDDETCFLSSGMCYFDTEVISMRLPALPVKSEKVKRIPGGFEYRWAEPKTNGNYVLGADTSEGLAGCDPNGFVIIDADTRETVCSYHGLWSPQELAEHIVRLSNEYGVKLVGIERENHGHAVLLRVQQLGVDSQLDKSHWQGGRLFNYGKTRNSARPGWTTNRETRPVMLAALAEYVNCEYNKIYDKMLFEECSAFRLQNNGRWEADPGQHDDAVMKYAIAVQMLNVRMSGSSIELI